MKISVRTLTGASISVDARPDDLIRDVKKLIQGQVAMRPDLQRLTFANERLANERTLASYNIGEGSIVYLVEGAATGSRIVAGGYGAGNGENQFDYPYGLILDGDQTMIIVDWGNHRVIEWKWGESNGKVLVGSHGGGKQLNQLNGPTDVVIDRQTNSLIICDRGNRRVVRWPRDGNGAEGEVLLENVACWGVALDEQGGLYVSDTDAHAVKRYPYPPGEDEGKVVVGGHGPGMMPEQLNGPSYICVDRQQNLYITDTWNHRVMKWAPGADVGTVAVRGFTRGLFVDAAETIYVADYGSHRIMRWPKGATEGIEVPVKHMEGDEQNQVFAPWGVYCDQHEHIYVGDHTNQRVQRFPLRATP